MLIWDRAAETCTARLTGHTGTVWTLAVSPDGTCLATAGGDGSVRIWSVPAGDLLTVMRTADPLRACAWGTDSRLLAVGGRAGLYLYRYRP